MSRGNLVVTRSASAGPAKRAGVHSRNTDRGGGAGGGGRAQGCWGWGAPYD